MNLGLISTAGIKGCEIDVRKKAETVLLRAVDDEEALRWNFHICMGVGKESQSPLPNMLVAAFRVEQIPRKESDVFKEQNVHLVFYLLVYQTL